MEDLHPLFATVNQTRRVAGGNGGGKTPGGEFRTVGGRQQPQHRQQRHRPQYNASSSSNSNISRVVVESVADLSREGDYRKAEEIHSAGIARGAQGPRQGSLFGPGVGGSPYGLGAEVHKVWST